MATRMLAALLLAVTGLVHLALFPSHAGLAAAPAWAHPKPPPTTQAAPPSTSPPDQPAGRRQGRPEPPAAAPVEAAMLPPSTFYVGWLFLAGGVASLALGLRILRRDQRAAWQAAALLCATMSLALLTARTTGLPGGYSEHGSLTGHLTLAAQTGVLALAAARLRRPTLARGSRWGRRPPPREEVTLP
jgi:hypothetical protein